MLSRKPGVPGNGALEDDLSFRISFTWGAWKVSGRSFERRIHTFYQTQKIWQPKLIAFCSVIQGFCHRNAFVGGDKLVGQYRDAR